MNIKLFLRTLKKENITYQLKKKSKTQFESNLFNK